MSKPSHGYSQLTPYFTVSDADGLIEFLANAFDAKVIKQDRYKDGGIQHARLIIGDSLLMLNQSNDSYPVNVSQMHLFVEDAELVYNQALSFGAISIMEPNTRPHGERMAGIKDPCSNIWWIASTP
ncbi:MAG: VOC family protein [Pseudomonadota bacterium]